MMKTKRSANDGVDDDIKKFVRLALLVTQLVCMIMFQWIDYEP